MPLIFTLDQVDIDNVHYVSRKRADIKLESTDRPGYQAGKEQGRLEDEYTSNIRSFTAECAVSRVFAITWNGLPYSNDQHERRKTLPDVGENGEVRTIRLDKTSIHRGWPVWKKDAGREIICCTVDGWTVTIYGYIMADEVLTNPSRFEVGPVSGCYFVPVSELEPFAMDLESFMAGRVLV